MIKKTYLIFFIITFIGCSDTSKKIDHNNQSAIIKEMLIQANQHYDSVKTYFNKNLIDHFPTEIDTNNISISESISDKSEEIRLEVTNKILNETLNQLINHYDSISIAVYQGDDTCLLIPNRHLNRDNFLKRNIPPEETLEYKNLRECCSSAYPVPNFWSNKYSTEKTECKLPSDFIIYVLDSKPGTYFNEGLLIKNKYMPVKWENGFSKGIAISKERGILIYWVIIW